MKPHFPKLNYSLITGWLFILSIPAIPVAWLFCTHAVLLWTIGFFAVMLLIIVAEFFYDEYTRKRKAKLAALQQTSMEELTRLLKSDNTRLRTEMTFLRKQLHEMAHAPVFKSARFQELISRIDIALNK